MAETWRQSVQGFLLGFPRADKTGRIAGVELVICDVWKVSETQGRSTCRLLGDVCLGAGTLTCFAHLSPLALQRTPDREPDISVLCLERRCVLGKWTFLVFSLLKTP